MKLNLIFLTLFVITLGACQNEPESPNPIQLDWDLASEQICKSQTIESAVNETYLLSLQTSSLCPNSGVRVVVSANGTEFYNFVVTSFPHDQLLEFPNNTNVQLSTCIEEVSSDVVCVWLGEVECLLSY